MSTPAEATSPATAKIPSRVADLITLTKLRLNLLVLITTAVGYYMASPVGMFNWFGFFHVLFGTALTAAASGVLNQWMEIHRDRQMPRTANRPLPAGRFSPSAALLLGTVLGIAGIGYLVLFSNLLAAGLAGLTLFTYLALYTPLKPISTLNTIVGAIPGALPPLIGFAAAANTLNAASFSLFVILFLWQMPHFLAIATLYRDDYRAGGYAMLPILDTQLTNTARQTIIYTLALLLASLSPTLFGMTGNFYTAAAAVLGIIFLAAALQFSSQRTRPSARFLFFASIIYLPLLLLLMVLDKN